MADRTNHQDVFLDFEDDFEELDHKALTALSPAERAAQVRARRTLWLYADALWDAAKASDPNPAQRPEYTCIAALRDLATGLHERARAAQTEAGEDEPERDPWPELPPLNTL